MVLDRIPLVEKEMLVVPRFVRHGDVCVDVGAAGGTYTLLLSRLVGPEGRVYAFEARPRSARLVDRLRRLLRVRNVVVHSLALGDRSGTTTLEIPHRFGIPFTTRSFVTPSGTDGATVTAPVARLDDIVDGVPPGRLTLLKIDVEGAEPAVLRGAVHVIERHRPVIVCEIEERHLRRYGQEPREVFGWLSERGYRPYVSRRGALEPVDGPDPSENDYVFLPS